IQDDSSDYHQYYIKIERKRLLYPNRVGIAEEKNEHYFIRINRIDLQRIIKFGFLGMLLSITGDLRTHDNSDEKKVEIIAEKIDFMVMPREGNDTHLIESRLMHSESRGYLPSLYVAAMRQVH
ncbi:MAG: hypothetical protein NTZ67_05035, partial [Gammaproteobacteria bacterium]|nr:hypothetical protein [Gammaproteobacteria bacterium]